MRRARERRPLEHVKRPRRPTQSTRAAPSGPTGAVERVLALQRSAGNGAVAWLLRSPVGMPLESRPIPLDDTGTTTLTMEGLGSFPIGSINIETRRQRKEEKDPKTFAAWTIWKRRDEHSQALFRANLDGTQFPVAEVRFKRGTGELVLKLQNVMITNFTTSSTSGEPYESLTLDGEIVQ
jgi:hypothetical protein